MVATLAWLVLAPADAEAGCSHQVTSREQARIDSMLLGATLGQLETATAPNQRSPAPCRGAWCDERRSTPVVPSGSVHAHDESWALSTTVAEVVPSTTSRLPERAGSLHTAHPCTPLFRPPRQSARP
jgi:hypothetical protein